MTRPFWINCPRIRVIEIDRHGEADAGRLADLADDGCIQADDLTPRVEERAARIAGVDRGIGLNDSLDRPSVLGLQRAIEAADDARGQGSFETERIAEGQNLLADQTRFEESPKLRGKSFSAGDVDQEDGDIVGGVGTDELGVMLGAVEERDADRVGTLDHVKIGENMALLVDHESGARSGGGLIAEEAEALGFGRDVHDALIRGGIDVHVVSLVGIEVLEHVFRGGWDLNFSGG